MERILRRIRFALHGAAEDPPPSPQAIELRVHGVSGTTPQALLDRQQVSQVAGDAIAGFYRPTIVEERTDDGPNPFDHRYRPAPQLEGYNWGGLTSGSAGRAFWLVLLPFTLANLVPRARPLTSSRSGIWLIWYLSRVLALALTALLVLAAAGVGQDLIGWQCLGSANCQNANPHWIFGRIFGDWSGGTRANGLSAEHALLIGTAVPALILFAIWFLSGRTINRYESIQPQLQGGAAGSSDGIDAIEVNLDSRWMWFNQAQVRRLRAAHVQVGVAVILWTLLGPMMSPWDISHNRPDLRGWSTALPLLGYEARTHLWALVPIAVVFYALISLARPRFVGRAESSLLRAISWFCWGVLGVTAAVAVFRLALRPGVLQQRYFSGVDGRRGVPVDGLPGYSPTLLGLYLFAMLIVVLLGLVDIVLALRAPRWLSAAGPAQQRPMKAGAWGLTSSVFAVLAVMLAAVFSAGGYIFAAAWLETGSVKPGLSEVARTARDFHLPEVARDAALAYVGAVAFLLAVLVVVAAWFTFAYKLFSLPGQVQLGPLDGAPAHDYPDLTADAGRTRQLRRDIFLARLLDRAPVLIGPLVLVGFLLGAGFAVLLFDHHLLHQHWAARATGRLTPEVSGPRYRFWSVVQLTGLGSYLAVLTVLGIVALGGLAFRAEATRKSVGILWDVASFWPRAAHPLAAPCYAERTVPDLVTRIAYHRCGPQRPVLVLAAHSQGCVISAAAVFHLSTCGPAGQQALAETKLLTFGNVLRRLYGRYFPAYFGPQRLHELQVTLTTAGETRPRWINLWRYTDYLGGQVTAGPPSIIPAGPAWSAPVQGPTDWEWHSPDPAAFGIQPGNTTWPPAHRHSDFWSDDSGYFQAAVQELIRHRR